MNQTIHVWYIRYIYLHLVDFYSKCWLIFHTWMAGVGLLQENLCEVWRLFLWPMDPRKGSSLKTILDCFRFAEKMIEKKSNSIPLDPKSMKNEGFRPPIYEFYHP